MIMFFHVYLQKPVWSWVRHFASNAVLWYTWACVNIFSAWCISLQLFMFANLKQSWIKTELLISLWNHVYPYIHKTGCKFIDFSELKFRPAGCQVKLWYEQLTCWPFHLLLICPSVPLNKRCECSFVLTSQPAIQFHPQHFYCL